MREVWREEARGRSKVMLGLINGLAMNVAKARCVEVDCKRKRIMLAKFRGGTTELRIETGRWRWSLVLCVPFYLTVEFP